MRCRAAARRRRRSSPRVEDRWARSGRHARRKPMSASAVIDLPQPDSPTMQSVSRARPQRDARTRAGYGGRPDVDDEPSTSKERMSGSPGRRRESRMPSPTMLMAKTRSARRVREWDEPEREKHVELGFSDHQPQEGAAAAPEARSLKPALHVFSSGSSPFPAPLALLVSPSTWSATASATSRRRRRAYMALLDVDGLVVDIATPAGTCTRCAASRLRSSAGDALHRRRNPVAAVDDRARAHGLARAMPPRAPSRLRRQT